MAARVPWTLKWRLSVLWILEWGITGAILTYLPLYFEEHQFGAELGKLMAVGAVGLWVAPFVVGQICDRWMATEKYLAIAHFVGGMTLILIPLLTEISEQNDRYYGALIGCIALYAIAYLPTIPLASALTFRHLKDPDSQFGSVRIWGTVGWMLSGLGLSFWLGRSEAYAWLSANYPGWKPFLTNVKTTFAWMPAPTSSDCFRIAALLSFALSSFCVFLPATPPLRRPKGSIAPLQILAMFKDATFTLLIAISFLLAIAVPLYAHAVPRLLEQSAIEAKWIPAVMTIGQVSEFPALLLLPLFLKRFGLKTTFAVGMGAWCVRYAVFALEDPLWLILTAVGLHGICHVFLIIVIQLYIDSRCRPDLRASAQNLFAFLTLGIATPLGFLVGDALHDWFQNHQGVDYGMFFAIPAAFVFVLLVVFIRWVHLEPLEHEEPSEPAPVPEEALNEAAQ
jgi:MFS family permease